MKCPMSSCSNNCKCIADYGVFLLFLALAVGVYLTKTNQQIFMIINSWYTILPVWLWAAANLLSYNKTMILPILILIITYIWRRDKIYNIILLIISYLAVFLALKYIVAEPRPYVVLDYNGFHFLNLLENKENKAYFSYPSGHVGNIAIFAFAISSMFFENKRFLQLLMLLLVVFIAIARICTGWHWPLDVITSGLFAYVLVKICLRIKIKNFYNL